MHQAAHFHLTPAPVGTAADEKMGREDQQGPISYSLFSFNLREDRQNLVR